MNGQRQPWAAIFMMAAFFLCGCATGTLLPRDADAAQAASGSERSTGVAKELEVQDRRGRLSVEERRRLLDVIDAQRPGSELHRHVAAQQSNGIEPLYTGGTVQLLIDGPATFQAMFAAIERARHTVLLESYIVEDADVALRLAALLQRKRSQGVEVAMIYDDVGSFGTDRDYFKDLRDAGVHTCAFNPLVPKRRLAYWNLAHRDHRKILVVDREIAFTGGINISAVYRSGSFSRSGQASTRKANDPNDQKELREDGWRDTQVRLTGPAAAALDDLFRETWEHQRCRPALAAASKQSPGVAAPTKSATPSAPSLPKQPHLVGILPSSPLDEFNRIYAVLLSAVDVSRRSVWLTMAYFAPTTDMIDALSDAARRGVDVRLILPSQSDFTPVLHAGRSHYTQLLEAGVKLFELQGAVLHAKTVVIDGVVSSVGSSNLDWRSLAGNNEINALVFGEEFAQRMQAMFERDLQACKPILLEEWRNRPAWQKAKEATARLLDRLW